MEQRYAAGQPGKNSRAQACKTLAISERTYYRWRREYGGMDVTQARKLKEIEKENTRLKKLFAPNVWSYDFMLARTQNGVPFWILNVIDEYSRECLVSIVARRLNHHDVLNVLTKLFIQKGVLVHFRSDNGSEFTAQRVH